MRQLANRVAGFVVLAAVLLGASGAHAATAVVKPGGYGAQDKATVDFKKKRTQDPRTRASLYGRRAGVPYLNHRRKDGRISQRRLWRRRRIGTPVVTRDLPAHLQRLEAWRARTGGAR